MRVPIRMHASPGQPACPTGTRALYTTQTPQTGQVGVPLEHMHCTPPKTHRLVQWVFHWNTLHTTQTPQTGQAISSLQRPLDLSTSGWLLLLFLYIPDGALPSNCCTLEQKILMPMKQSLPALPIRAIVVSCYP